MGGGGRMDGMGWVEDESVVDGNDCLVEDMGSTRDSCSSYSVCFLYTLVLFVSV